MLDDFASILLYKDLITEYLQQVLILDDGVLSCIQAHLILQGISFHSVKPKISITTIPTDYVDKILPYMEEGKCYHNADVACSVIKGARYVFGFWKLDKIYEHAWIKHDNKHYDPTCQILYSNSPITVNGYYPAVELEYSEVLKMKKTLDFKQQPDLVTYFASQGIKYNKIIDRDKP